jgi:ABC-type sugar transport system substrate-binding protein
MFKRSKRPGRIVLTVGVASALLFAACGSDDDSSSTTDAADSTDAPSVTEVATTEAEVVTSEAEVVTSEAEADTTDAPVTSDAEFSLEDQVAALLAGDLDFPRPEEPVDPGTHDVAVVAAGLASSGPATVASELALALDAIGWTAPDAYDGKFTPTEQAALIQKAVEDEADVIFLVAITPDAVAAGVSSAQEAGIPIMCILCGPDLPEGMIGIEADAEASGRGQAEFAVLNSDPDATIVVYQNTEFASSTVQSASAAARVQELCPDCTVETPSLLLAEAREAGAPIWTSLLGEYPEGELDYVILPFDSPSGALAQTASQLGRTDFGIVGFGALSPYVDMIGVGEPPTAKASLAMSTPYFAWAAVDQAARTLAGEENWVSDAMPVGLITMENFDSFPAGLPYIYPEFDYETEFPVLWGK